MLIFHSYVSLPEGIHFFQDYLAAAAIAHVRPRLVAQLGKSQLLRGWPAVRWMACRRRELVWRKVPGAAEETSQEVVLQKKSDQETE